MEGLTHTRTNTHTHTHTRTRTTHTHAYTYKTHSQLHTLMYTLTHAHTHTHARTHTQAHKLKLDHTRTLTLALALAPDAHVKKQWSKKASIKTFNHAQTMQEHCHKEHKEHIIKHDTKMAATNTTHNQRNGKHNTKKQIRGSKIMFSGDGREGVSQPAASQPEGGQKAPGSTQGELLEESGESRARQGREPARGRESL